MAAWLEILCSAAATSNFHLKTPGAGKKPKRRERKPTLLPEEVVHLASKKLAAGAAAGLLACYSDLTMTILLSSTLYWIHYNITTNDKTDKPQWKIVKTFQHLWLGIVFKIMR